MHISTYTYIHPYIDTDSEREAIYIHLQLFIYGERKKLITENWFTGLWRLKSPKDCSWKARDPVEPVL